MIFSSFLYCFFSYWLAWKSNNTALIFSPASIPLPLPQPRACPWWAKRAEYNWCRCGVGADVFSAYRMRCSQPLSASLVLEERGPCRRPVPGVWPLQTYGKCKPLWLSSDKAQHWVLTSLSSGSAGHSALLTWLSAAQGPICGILWCFWWSNWAGRSLPSLGWSRRETHLLIYPSIWGEVRALY